MYFHQIWKMFCLCWREEKFFFVRFSVMVRSVFFSRTRQTQTEEEMEICMEESISNRYSIDMNIVRRSFIFRYSCKRRNNKWKMVSLFISKECGLFFLFLSPSRKHFVDFNKFHNIRVISFFFSLMRGQCLHVLHTNAMRIWLFAGVPSNDNSGGKFSIFPPFFLPPSEQVVFLTATFHLVLVLKIDATCVFSRIKKVIHATCTDEKRCVHF